MCKLMKTALSRPHTCVNPRVYNVYNTYATAYWRIFTPMHVNSRRFTRIHVTPLSRSNQTWRGVDCQHGNVAYEKRVINQHYPALAPLPSQPQSTPQRDQLQRGESMTRANESEAAGLPSLHTLLDGKLVVDDVLVVSHRWLVIDV